MSGRDLLHTSAEHLAAVQSSHPGGALRVLLPLASLHSSSGDTALGSDILRVEAAASGMRAELNAALPEVASWWTTPALWLGPSPRPSSPNTAPGEAHLSPEGFEQMVSDSINSLLSWAEQVIVVTTTQARTALSPVLRALRAAGANVVWVAIEHGPEATFQAVDALRFSQPHDDGYLEATPSS
ncbi:MAG: hypothetical protein WD400_04500 [Pontimonas sp.]